METPKTTLAAKAGIVTGAGLGLFTQYYKGEKVISHDGSLPGFGSIMAFLPEQDLAFFYTCTTDESFVYDDLYSAVLEVLAGPQLDWAFKERKPATDISMAGYYRPRTVIYQFSAFIDQIFNISRIVEKNGKLFFTKLFDDTKYELYSENDQRLYYYNEDGFKTSIYATRDYDGKSVLMSGSSSGNLLKTTGFRVWSTILLTAICLSLILTLPVVLLIRLMVKLFTKKTITFNKTLQMGMASLACLMLIVLFFVYWSMGAETPTDSVAIMQQLGFQTLTSFSIFVLSILFGVFALLAFIFSILSFRTEMHAGLRVYSSLLGLALFIVTVYFWSYGLIGFQFWAY
jgi:hypothetical protein